MRQVFISPPSNSPAWAFQSWHSDRGPQHVPSIRESSFHHFSSNGKGEKDKVVVSISFQGMMTSSIFHFHSPRSGQNLDTQLQLVAKKAEKRSLVVQQCGQLKFRSSIKEGKTGIQIFLGNQQSQPLHLIHTDTFSSVSVSQRPALLHSVE